MRLPVIPTALVVAAVPVMIYLGLWQLERAEWKAGLLQAYRTNAAAAAIALPAALTDNLAFRRVRVTCIETRPAQAGAARAATTGRTGYRQAIWCRDRAGQPVLVSLGVASDPRAQVSPSARASFTGPLIPRDGEPAYLLIAQTPTPPLAPEAPPTPATIPDNHRSYAVQWFAFAATLTIIYFIYLHRWRRARPALA